MITFPNAKINIGLDVLRRRPDGYHDLSTVMFPIPWTDILEIVPSQTPSQGDTITVTGRKVDCPPEKNLVMKAVRALREKMPVPAVDIYLHKVIPDGAGLGGGSADAAFTLKALREIFNLDITDSALAEIASSIGADCPFFIYDAPMLCEDTGTKMTPIRLQLPAPLWIAVIKPPVSVSTRDAYAHISPAIPSAPLPRLIASLPIGKWQGQIKNDFEKSVFPIFPMIEDIKRRLMAMGALYTSMSGSGSAVYAIFDTAIFAEQMAETFTGCDTFVSGLK